jgi:hypothetical protein
MNSSAFALHCSNPELARVHHSGSIDSNTFFLWFVSGNDGINLRRLAGMSRHHSLFLWLGVQRKAEFIGKQGSEVSACCALFASYTLNCPILSETRAEERCEDESKDPEDASFANADSGSFNQKSSLLTIGPETAFPVPSSQPDLPIADFSFQ